MFILLLIVLFISYIIIKAVLFYIKAKKALANALINNTKCGEETCQPVTLLIQPIPSTISITDWKKDVANYCSTIIYSIEKSTKDNLKPIYPSELKVLQEIYDEPSNPMVAVIFSSGDNDAVLWIAFRGSQTSDDWKKDFELQQESFLSSQAAIQTKIHFLSDIKIQGNTPNIHKGFADIYQKIRTKIFNTIQNYDPNKVTIVVTGHSLGAALATLAGTDLIKNGYNNSIVYNFASPRIGDQTFVDIVNSSIKVYRIVNESDLVPNLPLAVEPNFVTPTNPLIYAHCGELKSFSENWFSILNNHLMPIYMKGLENI
jgi:triacylglycerol lipase